MILILMQQHLLMLTISQKSFSMRASTSSHPSPDDPAGNHNMRIIAGQDILISGFYIDVGLIFNGKFGPPCRPARLFLGVLENSQD